MSLSLLSLVCSAVVSSSLFLDLYMWGPRSASSPGLRFLSLTFISPRMIVTLLSLCLSMCWSSSCQNLSFVASSLPAWGGVGADDRERWGRVEGCLDQSEGDGFDVGEHVVPGSADYKSYPCVFYAHGAFSFPSFAFPLDRDFRPFFRVGCKVDDMSSLFLDCLFFLFGFLER